MINMTTEISLVVLYNKEKKLLLQNRKTISKFGEEWAFFGGKLEKEESPEDAIKREIKEELNYNIFNYKYVKKFKNKVNGSIIHVFTAPFSGDLTQFTLREGDGMKLFSIKEYKKLKLIPGTRMPEILDELF